MIGWTNNQSGEDLRSYIWDKSQKNSKYFKTSTKRAGRNFSQLSKKQKRPKIISMLTGSISFSFIKIQEDGTKRLRQKEELRLPIPKVATGRIIRRKRKSAKLVIVISRWKRGTMLISVKTVRSTFVTENYQTELYQFVMGFHLKTIRMNMFG